jgi:Protein of unknown function (DUF1579)
MDKKKTTPAKPARQLTKLKFLIGRWHTQGNILRGAPGGSTEIRGMDTYEWISGGFFILHRVDVLMGSARTEVIEIIGYDKIKRSYFMTSFDNQGATITMHAVLKKPGVLKLTDAKMQSTLSVDKGGNSMTAKWELSENGKTWKPWMNMKFSR